jgi:hypothetical protein
MRPRSQPSPRFAGSRRCPERLPLGRDPLSAALFEADPVGINFETNTDEYDAEAETIVIALRSAAGPEDMKALTHEAFVQWFGAATAGPIERYDPVAKEIWRLWRRHQG